jgi:hypothetical protein
MAEFVTLDIHHSLTTWTWLSAWAVGRSPISG